MHILRHNHIFNTVFESRSRRDRRLHCSTLIKRNYKTGTDDNYISNLTKARVRSRWAAPGRAALSSAARRRTRRRRRRRAAAPRPAVTAPRRTRGRSAAWAARAAARRARAPPAPAAASARRARASRAPPAAAARATRPEGTGSSARVPDAAVAFYCDSFARSRGFSECASFAWVVSRLLGEIHAGAYLILVRLTSWVDHRLWDRLHTRMVDTTGAVQYEGTLLSRSWLGAARPVACGDPAPANHGDPILQSCRKVRYACRGVPASVATRGRLRREPRDTGSGARELAGFPEVCWGRQRWLREAGDKVPRQATDDTRGHRPEVALPFLANLFAGVHALQHGGPQDDRVQSSARIRRQAGLRRPRGAAAGARSAWRSPGSSRHALVPP